MFYSSCALDNPLVQRHILIRALQVAVGSFRIIFLTIFFEIVQALLGPMSLCFALLGFPPVFLDYGSICS